MRRLSLLLGFVLAASAAHAQPFPNKPIRAIVPFPAGSATDGMARLVSAHFTKVFGHGLVIENMVGATGTIASRATAKAAPDGYTIMFSTNSTHSANAYLYNNLGYDPIGDFTPLALLSRAPHAMVVRADAPYPAFRDFIAVREGQSRQAQFRLRQYRQPRGRRDAERVCGNQDHRGLLSRHAAGDDRPARRADRFLCDGRVDDAGARQGRQAAHAGGDRVDAHGDFPRRADHDRARLSRTSCSSRGTACTRLPECRPTSSRP